MSTHRPRHSCCIKWARCVKDRDIFSYGIQFNVLFSCWHPHDALKGGQKIGTRAFGEVKKFKIQGISFLSEHVAYCGKLYKGDSSSKFEIFQAEQRMQVVYPSRCIAFTRKLPKIKIFFSTMAAPWAICCFLFLIDTVHLQEQCIAWTLGDQGPLL